MITAIAIDDEPLGLEIIESFCKNVDIVKLQKTFTSVKEANTFLSKNAVDLVFLDIQMPEMNGIEFYKKLKQNVMVIFTTAYSNYAVEGFDLDAIDYLLKPFSFERFKKAIKKAQDFHFSSNPSNGINQNYLFVRADYMLHQINFNQINLIESFGDYLEIHLDNNKKVTTRFTLKNIIDKLPRNQFVRVHRSYIVSLSKIENIRNKIISTAGRSIPIGATYEDDFFKFYKA